MFPVIQVGPLAIQSGGLFFLLGIYAAGLLAEAQAKKQAPQHKDAISTIIFLAALAGLVGARIGFVLRYPAAFSAQPWSALLPTPTMLDGGTGALTAALALFILGQRRKIGLYELADLLAPWLAGMAFFLALAGLASGSSSGIPTALPWGIAQFGAVRHPVGLYWLIGAGALLGLFWPRAPKAGRPAGTRFFSLAAAEVGLIILILPFRAETALNISGGMRTQVGALFLLAVCLGLLYARWNAAEEKQA